MSWTILQATGAVSLDELTGDAAHRDWEVEFKATRRDDDRFQEPEIDYRIIEVSARVWKGRSGRTLAALISQRGEQLRSWVRKDLLELLEACRPEPDSWTVIEESPESRRAS